jgi:tetratricopeptide (TPR) repeat protein
MIFRSSRFLFEILQCSTVFFITLFVSVCWANDPFSRNEYALDLLNRGEYAKAISQLQDAHRNYPYDEVIKKNLATGYVLSGQKFLGKGQLTEAIDHFERASELYPDDGNLQLFHGIALVGQKKYDYATVVLERARGISGESKAYYYHLGRVKYETGNLADAVELWEKALTLDPGDASLRTLLEKTKRELLVEGEMAKGFSGRFNISYDVVANAAFADEILQVLEEAYNKVGSLLNHYPEAPIPVLIYTQKDFKNLVKGPEWSGGVYDGKIRLPIGGIQQITPEVRAVLYHEYVHVIMFELTHGNCPMWLNEGIAEYVGRSQSSAKQNIRSIAVQQGKLLTIHQLEKSFTAMTARDAAIAYEQSYSLLQYLVTAFGWHKVNDLLRSLATGLPIVPAFRAAFSDFSLEYESMIADWQATLTNSSLSSEK